MEAIENEEKNDAEDTDEHIALLLENLALELVRVEVGVGAMGQRTVVGEAIESEDSYSGVDRSASGLRAKM